MSKYRRRPSGWNNTPVRCNDCNMSFHPKSMVADNVWGYRCKTCDTKRHTRTCSHCKKTFRISTNKYATRCSNCKSCELCRKGFVSSDNNKIWCELCSNKITALKYPDKFPEMFVKNSQLKIKYLARDCKSPCGGCISQYEMDNPIFYPDDHDLEEPEKEVMIIPLPIFLKADDGSSFDPKDARLRCLYAANIFGGFSRVHEIVSAKIKKLD